MVTLIKTDMVAILNLSFTDLIGHPGSILAMPGDPLYLLYSLVFSLAGSLAHCPSPVQHSLYCPTPPSAAAYKLTRRNPGARESRERIAQK